MKTRQVVAAMAALAWFVGSPAAWAGDAGHKHGDRKEPSHQAMGHEMPEHASGNAADTPAAIWGDIQTRRADLAKTIEAKQLEQVHERAFAVRDGVNALVTKSSDLPAEQLAKLKANAKFVADLAERLDKSGDSGDLAATQENFKKLDGVLKGIPSLYPPGTLGAPAM